MPTFPKRLTLALPELEREMLDYLARRLPQKTGDRIAHGVFSRGLAVVVEEERQKEGRVVQGERRLSASASKLHFHRPKYKPPSPVPEEVTLRLGKELRRRLERLLVSDRGSDLQSVIETALRLGLDEQRKPGALDPAKLFDDLKAKEAFSEGSARARRRKQLALLLTVGTAR
jgi:hypothetical protein